MESMAVKEEAAVRLDNMLTKMREFQAALGQDIDRLLADPSTNWYI